MHLEGKTYYNFNSSIFWNSCTLSCLRYTTLIVYFFFSVLHYECDVILVGGGGGSGQSSKLTRIWEMSHSGSIAVLLRECFLCQGLLKRFRYQCH